MSVKKLNSRKTIFCGSLVLALITQAGCGSPMSVSGARNSIGLSYDLAAALGIEDTEEAENLNALAQNLEFQEIDSREFGRSFYLAENQSSGSSGTDIYYSFSWSIPYGHVYKAAATAIKLAGPLTCKQLPNSKAGTQDYEDGEFPCGEIIDKDWKLLATLDVPDYQVKKSSSTYKLEGFKLPIKISRKQKTATYMESSLDDKAEVAKTSSARFARDLSIRYVPMNDSIVLDVCTNTPGIDVTVPPRNLTGKAKRKVLGIGVSLTGSGNVDFGTYGYALARACGQFKFSFDGNAKTPVFQGSITDSPHLFDTTYSGFKLRFRTWWLKALDGLADFFGKSIHETIERAVDRGVENFSKNEVETGKWMDRLVDESFRKDLIKATNENALKEIEAQGILIGMNAFKSRVIRQCRKLSLNANLSKHLEDFKDRCEDFVGRIDIRINPFYRDPALEAKGCYSHYASVFETEDSSGRDKWWTEECAFKMRAQLRIADLDRPDLPNFLALLNLDDRKAELTKDLEETRTRNKLQREEMKAMADQILRKNPELRDGELLKREIIARLGQ